MTIAHDNSSWPLDAFTPFHSSLIFLIYDKYSILMLNSIEKWMYEWSFPFQSHWYIHCEQFVIVRHKLCELFMWIQMNIWIVNKSTVQPLNVLIQPHWRISTNFFCFFDSNRIEFNILDRQRSIYKFWIFFAEFPISRDKFLTSV